MHHLVPSHNADSAGKPTSSGYNVTIFSVKIVDQLLQITPFSVGLRIRTALICSIYKKSLRMSSTARKEFTTGEIVNLMAVDAQRFQEMIFFNMLWIAPIQIILTLYFLWQLLGVASLSGVGVMILLIPINSFLIRKLRTLQVKQMQYKDKRAKLTNEVLCGIRTLKLYHWEPPFEEQIFKIRNKEIAILRRSAFHNAAVAFIFSCAPFFVRNINCTLTT